MSQLGLALTLRYIVAYLEDEAKAPQTLKVLFGGAYHLLTYTLRTDGELKAATTMGT